jgi:hypothetical protein
VSFTDEVVALHPDKEGKMIIISRKVANIIILRKEKGIVGNEVSDILSLLNLEKAISTNYGVNTRSVSAS